MSMIPDQELDRQVGESQGWKLCREYKVKHVNSPEGTTPGGVTEYFWADPSHGGFIHWQKDYTPSIDLNQAVAFLQNTFPEKRLVHIDLGRAKYSVWLSLPDTVGNLVKLIATNTFDGLAEAICRATLEALKP